MDERNRNPLIGTATGGRMLSAWPHHRWFQRGSPLVIELSQ